MGPSLGWNRDSTSNRAPLANSTTTSNHFTGTGTGTGAPKCTNCIAAAIPPSPSVPFCPPCPSPAVDLSFAVGPTFAVSK